MRHVYPKLVLVSAVRRESVFLLAFQSIWSQASFVRPGCLRRLAGSFMVVSGRNSWPNSQDVVVKEPFLQQTERIRTYEDHERMELFPFSCMNSTKQQALQSQLTLSHSKCQSWIDRVKDFDSLGEMGCHLLRPWEFGKNYQRSDQGLWYVGWLKQKLILQNNSRLYVCPWKGNKGVCVCVKFQNVVHSNTITMCFFIMQF